MNKDIKGMGFLILMALVGLGLDILKTIYNFDVPSTVYFFLGAIGVVICFNMMNS